MKAAEQGNFSNASFDPYAKKNEIKKEEPKKDDKKEEPKKDDKKEEIKESSTTVSDKATSTSSPEEEPKAESEEEDWEKKNDFKIENKTLPPVMALVEPSNDTNKLSEESPSPQISLRPGGSSNFASTTLKPLDIEYPPGNWSPENPKGKKNVRKNFFTKIPTSM